MPPSGDGGGGSSIQSMISRFRNSRPTSSEDRAQARQRGELKELWYVRNSVGSSTNNSLSPPFKGIRHQSPARDSSLKVGGDLDTSASLIEDSLNGVDELVFGKNRMGGDGLQGRRDGSLAQARYGEDSADSSDMSPLQRKPPLQRTVDDFIAEDVNRFLRESGVSGDRDSRRVEVAPSPRKPVMAASGNLNNKPRAQFIPRPAPTREYRRDSSSSSEEEDPAAARKTFGLDPIRYTGSLELRSPFPYGGPSDKKGGRNNNAQDNYQAEKKPPIPQSTIKDKSILSAAAVSADLDLVLARLREGMAGGDIGDIWPTGLKHYDIGKGFDPSEMTLREVGRRLEEELGPFTKAAKERDAASAEKLKELEAWQAQERKKIEAQVRSEAALAHFEAVGRFGRAQNNDDNYTYDYDEDNLSWSPQSYPGQWGTPPSPPSLSIHINTPAASLLHPLVSPTSPKLDRLTSPLLSPTQSTTIHTNLRSPPLSPIPSGNEAVSAVESVIAQQVAAVTRAVADRISEIQALERGGASEHVEEKHSEIDEISHVDKPLTVEIHPPATEVHTTHARMPLQTSRNVNTAQVYPPAVRFAIPHTSTTKGSNTSLQRQRQRELYGMSPPSLAQTGHDIAAELDATIECMQKKLSGGLEAQAAAAAEKAKADAILAASEKLKAEKLAEEKALAEKLRVIGETQNAEMASVAADVDNELSSLGPWEMWHQGRSLPWGSAALPPPSGPYVNMNMHVEPSREGWRQQPTDSYEYVTQYSRPPPFAPAVHVPSAPPPPHVSKWVSTVINTQTSGYVDPALRAREQMRKAAAAVQVVENPHPTPASLANELYGTDRMASVPVGVGQASHNVPHSHAYANTSYRDRSGTAEGDGHGSAAVSLDAARRRLRAETAQRSTGIGVAPLSSDLRQRLQDLRLLRVQFAGL